VTVQVPPGVKTKTPSAPWPLFPVQEPVHSAPLLAWSKTVVSGAPWKLQVDEH
jgi:hypothetical protein